MKKYLIALLLISLAGCSGKHFEPLSGREIAKEATYIVLNLIDREQTLDIKNHPYMYEKVSSGIYGDHPSDDRVNLIMSIGVIGHPLVTWWLPKKLRPVWQGATIGVEAMIVYENDKKGLGH